MISYGSRNIKMVACI